MHPCKFLPSVIFPLLLAAISFFPVFELQAGASNKSGNPYGNGSFFPDNGTFSAIVRGGNGFLGVMEITTSASNSTSTSISNSGIATVFANGQQFTGSAFGAMDNSQTTLSATYFANSVNQVVTLPTVSYTLETIVTGGVTNTYPLPSYGLTNFSVSNNISGQFQATLQNQYPNQILSGGFGSGQASVTIQTPSYSNSKSIYGDNYEYSVSNVTTTYFTSESGSRLSQ